MQALGRLDEALVDGGVELLLLAAHGLLRLGVLAEGAFFVGVLLLHVEDRAEGLLVEAREQVPQVVEVELVHDEGGVHLAEELVPLLGAEPRDPGLLRVGL